MTVPPTSGTTVRPDGADPLVRARTTVAVVDTPTSELLAEWEELARAARAGPLLGPHAALAWWRHRGRGSLNVVTARVGGSLVALAPLHRRRIGPVPVLRWLGHGLGTVAEMLVRPGFGAAAGAVWEHVAGESGALLDLVEYRDDGGGLIQLRRSRLRCVAALRDVCPVVDASAYGSAGELLGRLHRRHPLRRALDRSERTLAAHGSRVVVSTATDRDGLDRLLPDLTAVHDAAEAHRPRLHLLRPPWRAYLLDVLDGLLARGAASVFLLRIDDAPAAFEITVDREFAGARTMESRLARFHPRHAAVTPGHLLTRAVVEHAACHGATRYDLGIGDGPHKLPWATGSYDTLTVRAADGPLWPRQALLATASLARRAGRPS